MTKRRKRPTIYDVAERAGVSVFTVSRVINDSGFVRQQTRQRVEQAVAELAYIPSAAARRLRSRRSHAIGLLVHRAADPFWHEIVVGVQSFFAEQDMGVLLGDGRMDLEEERSQLEVALSQGVDGFVVAPVSDDSSVVSEIVRRGIPCVAVDRYLDLGVDVVRRDLYGAARELTELLSSLGHRRIALVNGPRNDAGAQERFKGYMQALRAADIPVDEALVAWGDWTKPFGARAAGELLSIADPPTAFIAAANMYAEGVLETVRAVGMEVPRDVAIVSFGATPSLFSFLTAAASPAAAMGEAAAEMLYQRIQGYEGPPRERVFHAVLHKRLSAGPHVAEK
jgi:LacI family transcriptional regulator